MGLLIGRVVKDYSSTITIQDYVLAGYTSESVSSRLWSDERLADMIKPWSRQNSSTYVVGFFRSQSEEWPEIAKEDLKGAKKLLKRTPNVFLLIRSGLSRSYAGRLFLRPSWRGKLDEEYGEFPLNADILRSQWDATAPKHEGPSLHFVPGNPLQGKQRPEPPRYIQDAVEAVFEPVMPSNEEVLAEASIHSVAVPMVEMQLLESLEEPEVAKPSLWARLFRRAEQEEPAFDTSAAATQPETPDVQPVAAARVVEIFDPSMEPAKRSLWAKLFRRSTLETPAVEALAINNAWEVPATEEVCAEPAEVMHSEIAAELPAMHEAPSAMDAPPAKQSLWAEAIPERHRRRGASRGDACRSHAAGDGRSRERARNSSGETKPLGEALPPHRRRSGTCSSGAGRSDAVRDRSGTSRDTGSAKHRACSLRANSCQQGLGHSLDATCRSHAIGDGCSRERARMLVQRNRVFGRSCSTAPPKTRRR